MSALDNTLGNFRAHGASIPDVVARAVDSAERLNSTLNAFLQIDRQGAVNRATSLEERKPSGLAPSAPLYGAPIAVKDNICVRGMQATCGSRILAGYHPPYNATVIERLIFAGAVIIGKTNCDEFAMG